LGVVQAYQTLSQFKFYSMLAWLFFRVNVVLMWLGMQPVEDPYVFIGQVATVLYFFYILIVLILDFLNKNIF
jgi:ubiquinol-cytochrome c reductase cytochrome b subunit